ncbi:MAG: hypothetical protein CMJ18_04885 [Phycisphaeraceae bacterium]|nr:hypothetical protein [Phycisphaeraceae bacterium]
MIVRWPRGLGWGSYTTNRPLSCGSDLVVIGFGRVACGGSGSVSPDDGAGHAMNQKIFDRVLRSSRLPSLPTIALEVIDLVQQADVSFKEIAETIQHDPALSSKILKTVNSSFYGQSQSVGTVSQALVILGLNSVKTLALGFSLTANLKNADADAFDHLLFWKRSLYSAVAARALSQKIGLAQQEEAFLSALLQDLGMLAMVHTLGEPYKQIVAEAGTEHRKLAGLERRELETDHTQIGGALAQAWKLPPLMVHSISHHEKPSAAPSEVQKLIQCVAVGSSVADVFVSESPGTALDRYYRYAQQWFKMPRTDAEPVLNVVHKDTVEMRRLFDLPTGDLDNPDEILGRANEALIQVGLQSAQESVALEQQNRDLHEKATTDPLTKVANRGCFNEFLSARFNEAGPGAPLSVMFLDTDHFKNFNDTYGHQLGDKVLVVLAETLTAQAPEGAMVARYGGEEFALVLPGHDRVSAARLAEQTRCAIEATPVESESGLLSITASIGVATYDGSFFKGPELLVKAADQAVYAAKSGGRNCVRVFAPRPAAKRAVA